jgi:hypothetical protein
VLSLAPFFPLPPIGPRPEALSVSLGDIHFAIPLDPTDGRSGITFSTTAIGEFAVEELIDLTPPFNAIPAVPRDARQGDDGEPVLPRFTRVTKQIVVPLAGRASASADETGAFRSVPSVQSLTLRVHLKDLVALPPSSPTEARTWPPS